MKPTIIKKYLCDDGAWAWVEDRDGRIFLGNIWTKEAIEVFTIDAADKIADLLLDVFSLAQAA